MIRSAPVWRALAVLGAASLALAACGGDGGEEAAPSKSASAPAKGDGVLTIGTILPQTGSLAFLGPPEFAGVDLAVNEINAAGGVLGKPITKIHKDSGDATTDIASRSVDSLLQSKADAIVGAASSGVSLTVIDKIVGAGVIQFSPANTSDAFSTYNDKGLYFRTAPPDKLQGRVLADTVIGDGNETVAILARQDSYGTGLANNTEAGLTGGGAEVVEKIFYDEKAADFSAEVSKIKTSNPQAIVLVAFEETNKIVPELVRQGLSADKVKWYFVDGNLSNYGKDFRNGTLEGVKGTLPGAAAPAEFQAKLKQVDPKLEDYSYGPESYDAINLIALAAEAAKSDDGAAIAAKLVEVSKGGEKCKNFAECNEMLKAGKDIDYDGVSGPIEFNDAGDPSEATIGIYQYGKDNIYKNIDYSTGKIEG